MDPEAMQRALRNLLEEEELVEPTTMFQPRHWDEVPLASRYHQLAFMAEVDTIEQTRILVVCAVRHLKELRSHIAAAPPGTFVAVSVSGWPDLKPGGTEPLIPCFLVSTDPGDQLGALRLCVGSSEQSSLVRAWLDPESDLTQYLVLESSLEDPDPDLFRVFIAHPDDLDWDGHTYRRRGYAD